MSYEPDWRRKKRIAREVAEEAAAAERAAAIVGVDEPEADSLDCPSCGAKVNGQWAVIDTFAATNSSPAESDPFCVGCVPWRWRNRLLDVLRRED